jgi:hypothetical protein
MATSVAAWPAAHPGRLVRPSDTLWCVRHTARRPQPALSACPSPVHCGPFWVQVWVRVDSYGRPHVDTSILDLRLPACSATGSASRGRLKMDPACVSEPKVLQITSSTVSRSLPLTWTVPDLSLPWPVGLDHGQCPAGPHRSVRCQRRFGWHSLAGSGLLGDCLTAPTEHAGFEAAAQCPRGRSLLEPAHRIPPGLP